MPSQAMVAPVRPDAEPSTISASPLQKVWLFVLAVLLPGLALLFTYMLPVAVVQSMGLLGTLSVLISALVGGRRAGYISTVSATAGLNFAIATHDTPMVQSTTILVALFFGVCAAVTEIIHRMQRHQVDLAEREHRIRLAQRVARIWFWEWDLRLDRVIWSGLGTKRRDIEHGSDTFENYLETRVHPEDRDRVRSAMVAAAEKSAPSYQCEHRVIGREGRVIWVTAKGKTFVDEHGPKLMLGMSTDITERKQAEEAGLRASAVLSSLVEGVCYTDPRGRVIYLNPAAERLLGLPSSEARGCDLHELLHGQSSEYAGAHRESCCVLRAIRQKKHWHEPEDIFQRRGGGTFPVEFTAAPVKDDKRVIGAVLLFRDISERKRVEATLVSSEKLAATGRIAATISHELNNPLEAVTNLLYIVAASQGLSEPERGYLKTADQELGRMAQIIRQTLGMHRQSNHPVPMSPARLLEGVLLLLSKKLEQKQIQVEQRFEFTGEVPGFPAELRQVFSNLVVNATEAMAPGGKLCVAIHDGKDWSTGRDGVRMVILDRGPGIAREAQRHLFEAFFTTKGEKGTGLGLWVSKGIIAKHNGQLRVYSSTRPGRSFTCFSIWLPLTRPARSHDLRAA